MKILSAGLVVSLSLAVGCSVEAGSPPTEVVTSNLMAHACNVPGLTPAQVADCIRWIDEQTHDPAYCTEYNCVDFSNTYCEGAANYGVGCAELAVQCGNNAHSVSVVFFPGVGCMVVEPQNGNTIAGPYPALNGSCNTFSPGVAQAVCTSVGGHKAECTSFTRGEREQGWTEGCHDLAVPAAAAVAE